MYSTPHLLCLGTVTELRLDSYHLTGSLPSDPAVWEPFSVTMKKLILAGDNSAQVLMGTIPPSLSLLSNLQTLKLRGNGGCQGGR